MDSTKYQTPSRSLPPKTSSLISIFWRKKDSWKRIETIIGRWRPWRTSWIKMLRMYQRIYFICSRFVLGTSVFRMKNFKEEGLTSYLLWNKEMMVRLIVINGFSKVFVSTWSLSTPWCLTSVLKLMTMQSQSYSSTCRQIGSAVDVVVKLRLTFQLTGVLIYHILLRQLNFMSIS